MSKSKGNVVDPDELVRRYGADTARLFSMFAAPPEKDLDWSEHGVEGAYRFLGRVWRLAVADARRGGGGRAGWEDPGASPDLGEADRALRSLVHETIARVSRDIGERMHFNTAVAAVMELVNEIYRGREGQGGRDPQAGRDAAIDDFAIATVIRLLHPFVPHLACELWERRVDGPPLAEVAWPDHDPAALVKEEVEIAVQINGKLRSRLLVPTDAGREEVAAAALADQKIAAELGGREPRKTVVVPGRLVNVVV